MSFRLVRAKELLEEAHELLNDEIAERNGPLMHRAERTILLAIHAVDAVIPSDSGDAA